MPSPPSSGLPCPTVRRSERIKNRVRPIDEIEYRLEKITVPTGQTTESPKPSTSEEQIKKGASRYSVDSGLNFSEYRDPTLRLADNSSDSESEGQSISFSPDRKGTSDVSGLKSGELINSTDLNLTKTPTTGDELGSILEELEESLCRSHSPRLPLDSGKESSGRLDPTTLDLATGLTTWLVGQRRYDSSDRTLIFGTVDPQTTIRSLSGTVNSRFPEIKRDSEGYRPALDMSAKAKEPVFFYGAPEEDAQDWLKRFERFKKKFIENFTENIFYQVEAKIRSRKLGLNEPVRNYYYDILDSFRQLELEQGRPKKINNPTQLQDNSEIQKTPQTSRLPPRSRKAPVRLGIIQALSLIFLFGFVINASAVPEGVYFKQGPNIIFSH